MKFLKPDVILNRVFDLDTEKLKNRGIKCIVFDIDNTLAYNAEQEPGEEVKSFLSGLQQKGFQIALVSNNKKERVLLYNRMLNLPCAYRACKPLGFKLMKIVRAYGVSSSEVCMVGDQLFTDVWGGKRMGMFTVLVTPFDEQEEWFIRLKRKIERFLLK